MATKHTMPRLLTIGAALMFIASACGTSTGSPAASGGGGGGASADLVNKAKTEGALNVIALPDDWCNYKDMKAGFTTKYGIKINDNNPDAGSGDEIEAIKSTKGQTGNSTPDVVDVGIAFGDSSKKDGLFQAYKVSTWDSIDPKLKDPDGFWYGDYFSVLTFEVNKTAVPNTPKAWADLLKPEYRNQVALAGDPRVSSQAYNAVYAAALANGGSLDNAQPGLDFFKKLVTAGNFVPTIAKPGTIDQGATPITIRWAYNALAHKDAAAGNPVIDVVVPSDNGKFLGVYAQAISAYAPHPNAAKLWMEYLYSDEGQLLWLKGYTHPARYLDLAKRKKIPAALAKKLPSASAYKHVKFASLTQIANAQAVLQEQWAAKMG